jgi:hypothetical protein
MVSLHRHEKAGYVYKHYGALDGKRYDRKAHHRGNTSMLNTTRLALDATIRI